MRDEPSPDVAALSRSTLTEPSEEVCLWHFSDVLRQSSDVRCWRVNRPKSAAPEGRLLTRSGLCHLPGFFVDAFSTALR